VVAGRSDEDEDKIAAAQARADEVFSAHGGRAPRPLVGESLLLYRVRLAKKLQHHSKTWGDADLIVVAKADADKTFRKIEDGIYTEAKAAAMEPTNIADGEPREVHRRDSVTGRTLIEWHGRSPKAWMAPMMPARQMLVNLDGKPRN